MDYVLKIRAHTLRGQRGLLLCTWRPNSTQDYYIFVPFDVEAMARNSAVLGLDLAHAQLSLEHMLWLGEVAR